MAFSSLEDTRRIHLLNSSSWEIHNANSVGRIILQEPHSARNAVNPQSKIEIHETDQLFTGGALEARRQGMLKSVVSEKYNVHNGQDAWHQNLAIAALVADKIRSSFGPKGA